MMAVANVVAPVNTPVTTPEETVAIPGALLLQAPNGVASLKLVVSPWHTTGLPAIDAGNGLTVTIADDIHPVGSLYVIVAVPNGPVPVTKPVMKSTLAVPGTLLLHVPDGVKSLNCVVRPEHTFNAPVIAAGNGFTVIVAVIRHVVGKV